VVGDGINDTPAMAASAASVSIGEGAALARSASDAVLTGSDLGRLLVAIDLARRVHAGVRSNIRFAVVYNVIGIVLAASGILHPIVAALLMLASSATVSVRALRSAEPTLAANGSTDAARDLPPAENESGFPRSPSAAGPEAPPPFSGSGHQAT
jgi:cation transport ATPase